MSNASFLLNKTSVYDAYWRFACERQNIFFKRINGEMYPWTDDDILLKYKFTNVYRATDRVSQYLIKNVIYSGEYSPEDQLFRILLFKIFNKIETWDYLKTKLGEIRYTTFDIEQYDSVLCEMISNRMTIYSAAYIMPSGKSSFGSGKKHRNNLLLLDHIMKDGLSGALAKMKTMDELYEKLLSYDTIGEFLAFQYAVDINYSELCDFSEMDFVKAGPGAKRGIEKCFSNFKNYTYEDIIRYVADVQEKEFERLGLEFKTLYGRPMQLIDCQNVFCEIDKYSRVAFPEYNESSNRTRIKQQYIFENKPAIDFMFPPKWGLNNFNKKNSYSNRDYV